MKILTGLMIGVIIVALSGCAMVRVKTPTWQMSAGSIFKQIEIPKVDIGEKGDIHMEGYKGMVAGEELGNAVKAATAIK